MRDFRRRRSGDILAKPRRYQASTLRAIEWRPRRWRNVRDEMVVGHVGRVRCGDRLQLGIELERRSTRSSARFVE